MRAAPLIAVALGGLAAGCTSDRCKSDSDCFVPEVCVERRCEPPMTIISDEDTATMDNADVGIDSAPSVDTDPPVTDMAVAPDMPRPDVGSPDTGSPDLGGPDAAITSCQIDPFTFMCTADTYEPNNIRFDGAQLSDETHGCPVNTFKPLDTAIEAVMCPFDGTDWYRVNFVECEDAAIVVEAQVELLSDCDPAIVGLRAAPFDCADDLVECTMEDGKPTLRAIIEREDFPQVQTAYFEVHHKMQQDVTFDYRLSVQVRR